MLKIAFFIISFRTAVSELKCYMNFSSPLCVLHVPPISPSFCYFTLRYRYSPQQSVFIRFQSVFFHWSQRPSFTSKTMDKVIIFTL
jgi:hypothetical protein